MNNPAATVAMVALLTLGTAQAAAGSANGLIVQLRDAPTYQQVEREKALSATGRSASGEKHRERLQRVLREAALDRAAIDVPSAPAILETGDTAQLLRFEKRLSATQAQRLAQRLRARADVEWVEPNTRERLLQTSNPPTDPYFSRRTNTRFPEGQWWLYSVSGTNSLTKELRLRGVPGFQTAWTRFNGSGRDPVVVAVLDTGITAHSELEGRLLDGYDFVTDSDVANDRNERDDDENDPGDWVSQTDLQNPAYSECSVQDSSWHGTKIAGQIAALTNNGVTVAGANWNARILPVRVAGKCGADVVDIAAGIRWAAGLSVPDVRTNPTPAKIINISFGGTGNCSSTDEGRLYQQAINAARDAGAIVVAAAGNEHQEPTRPASCTDVVGVGALNRDGFKASYSNFGPQLTISTVGGDTASTGAAWNSFVADTGLLTLSNAGLQSPEDEDYANVTGTSFAAPVVSAAISLMWGLNPLLSRSDVITGLRTSARPHVTSNLIGSCSDSNPGRCICTTSTCGVGILDVDRALQWVQLGGVGTVQPDNIDADDVRNAVASSKQDRPANPADSGGGGGSTDNKCGNDGVCGGALQPAWLLGLLAASGTLLWRRRAPRPARLH